MNIRNANIWGGGAFSPPMLLSVKLQLSSDLTGFTYLPRGREGTCPVGTSGKTELRCMVPSCHPFLGEQAAYKSPQKVTQKRVPTF